MTAYAQQIPLDLGHRPAHGREDFLVASNNEQAVSWIDRWPEWPAPALIIYGPTASGKSHLSAVWQQKTDAFTVNMADFENSDAGEITEQKEHILLENADLWLGTRDTETILFHLYNILREENRTMMLTMKNAPTHINFTIPDLASRLRAAPAVAIDPPDDTLLQVILVKMFSDRQLQVGQDVLKYILPRMDRSFAAARDLVDAADKLALSEKRPITIPLIRRVLMQEDLS